MFHDSSFLTLLLTSTIPSESCFHLFQTHLYIHACIDSYGDISTELQFLRKKRLHILHFGLVSFLFLFQIQHSLIQFLSSPIHRFISYTNLFGQRIRETGRRGNGHFLFRIAFTHSTNQFYRNGGIQKENEETTPAVPPTESVKQVKEEETPIQVENEGISVPSI